MTRTVTKKVADPRSALAAFLSFLLPGAGQAYNGQPWLACLLAVPVLMLIALAVAAAALLGSGILSRLLDTRVLIALIVLDAALLGWRLVAIVQAHVRRDAFKVHLWPGAITGILVVVTFAMHAMPAFYVLKTIDTLGAISLEGGGAVIRDGRQPLPEPINEPELSRGERVTILLVGIDFGPGRAQRLTDTMLVASVDPGTGQAAMISIPRDLYGVPLPDGTRYDAKLNSLMSTADALPEAYPLGGPGTLKRTIGDLLGTEIHYFAAIDLAGMREAIDSVGGVDVTVTEPVSDPTYVDEFGGVTNGFFIEPGVHHMDGVTALAYVRSRMGDGDSDFTRAERQQQLLTALRDRLTAGHLLVSLPGLLDAVKASLVTDVPSARLPQLAEVVERANGSIDRYVLTPPEYVTPEPFSAAGYILHPNLDAIEELGSEIFGAEPAASRRRSEAI